MSVDEDVTKVLFPYFDEHKEQYIQDLGEAVAIPSVSANLDVHLGDIVRMIEWVQTRMEALGGRTQVVDNPVSTPDRPLPPILLADFTSNSNTAAAETKKTVCIYAHLDVQPAALEDGWESDPFVLTRRNDKLYGRGSTDDKGPALSWLWVLEAYKALNLELPVNIKFMMEGMEESGSEGIYEVIAQEANGFLKTVDFFCISDSYWLGKTKPCLTYGLRGLAYFELTVQGAEQDLHSGVLGGTVHEAMTDLIRLMATLVDSQGKILVDGVMKDVAAVTPEEEALYEKIDFDMQAYKQEHTVESVSNTLLHDNKKDLLMARWRYPTLSLHGIEGGFSGTGAKTVIPAKVKGKFSLRLVPDQDPKQIEQVVTAHVQQEFAKLNSPNRMSIELLHGAKAWLASPNHPNYQAAANAIQRVYGPNVTPDYTREGGSIPLTNALEDATGGMNVLLLPIGACDDMAHSQNEKYNISNLMNGVKVLATYLDELGQLQGPNHLIVDVIPLD